MLWSVMTYLNTVKKDDKEMSELTDGELKEVTGGTNGFTMMSGAAGAYGGTTTATGEIIDDCSMGVAIPMSWPNFQSYLGRSILITYGGMTVLAKINDVGALSGRNLDLQPGVFRSFGAKSCADWGIRVVSYSIL